MRNGTNRHYRRRVGASAEDDLAWLRTARRALREAAAVAFTSGIWPLRAKAMDRVLRALGALQHELHEAIAEAHQEARGDSPESRNGEDWLGYPPPRR